ncbi:MAG TPA: PadR family transcriptional regulator [Acidimicrobiales bacterium]|jgi:PadR family transcriptional regulator PadR
MIDAGWPSEWLRGILPLCVIAIVINGETHGYAIARKLEQEGIPNVKGGTLYPLLARLEHDGLVTTRWALGPNGPGRKLYSVTPAGRVWFRGTSRNWQQFSALTVDLLTDVGKRKHA